MDDEQEQYEYKNDRDKDYTLERFERDKKLFGSPQDTEIEEQIYEEYDIDKEEYDDYIEDKYESSERNSDYNPLTEEELEIYRMAVKKREQEASEREKRLVHERIQKEKDDISHRLKWRDEINKWKRERNVPISELPEMPLLKEYQMMLEFYEEEAKKKRIELAKKHITEHNSIVLERKKRVYKGKPQGDLKKMAQNMVKTVKTVAKPVKTCPNIETAILPQTEEQHTEIQPVLPELVKGKTMDLTTFLGTKSNPAKLCFSFSSIDAQPTKGVGESGEGNFDKLGRIKDWRKKLSNLWKAPFYLDGKHWQSVEHYIQSKKFVGEFADSFALESKSELSTYPLMAKFAGSKEGLFRINGKMTLIRPKHIKMVSSYMKNAQKFLILAIYAKFSQDEHLGRLLLETGNAELWEDCNKRATWLEKVRNCIRYIEDNGLEYAELSSKFLY